MDIAEKVLRAKTDFDDVYEAGKKAEYDVFWDTYQINGTRDSYENTFSGKGWTDTNFKPKHKIIMVGDYGANGAFRQSKITDLKGILEKQGVEIDSSLATRFTNTFQSSDITRIPVLDMSSCSLITNTFNSYYIKEIEIHNLQSNCVFTNPFSGAKNLEKLILINSTIGQNGFDIHWSTNLTAESIDSIVRALSTTTTGLTITLPKDAWYTHASYYGGPTTSELWESRRNWSINELAV